MKKTVLLVNKDILSSSHRLKGLELNVLELSFN